MDIVFRVDGGPQIGYGHLIRSGALAEELQRRGHTVTVATTTPGPAKTIFPADVLTVELPSRENPRPFVDWLGAATADIVFTDAYPVDTEYQRAVRDCLPLAVLQDDARHAVCADILVNGNLYGANLDYDFRGHPPETCLGPEYLLVREPIRRQIRPLSRQSVAVERLLITMGGSDIRNTTPMAMRAIDKLDLDADVDVIIGPGFTNGREIEAVADRSNTTFQLRHDPPNLPELMARADIAVTACGTTVYELLAVGTPFVGLPQVDNQQLIAKALRERDLAEICSPTDDISVLTGAIERYVSDPDLCEQRRHRGKQLVDGRGASRVVDAL